MTRSDDFFAADSGVVYPVHCLTRRDVALTSTVRSWETRDGSRHTRLMCRFKLPRVDSERGAGAESSLRADGGAVALVLELLSLFPGFPDHASFSSYPSGIAVIMIRYDRALRAVKKVVAKSSRNPDEFAVHSLLIGGAATLVAGGDLLEGVIQREWRWRSGAYKV